MKKFFLTAALVAATGSAAMGQVLYDNGPTVTSTGNACAAGDQSLLETALLSSLYGFGWQVSATNAMADDFVIPAGQTWNVTGFTLWGYQTNAAAVTYTDVRMQIWNGRPGDAGSVVVAGDLVTNRLGTASMTNIYRAIPPGTDCARRFQRLDLNLAATLPALPAGGAYWIETTAVGSAAFSGPWMPVVKILGLPGKPGANGRQRQVATWVDAMDAGSATQQDIPFLVNGTLGGCYPDCNGDGILNLADFGCFQTKFATAQAYADCNGDGLLNLADFGCFQTKFALGCP